MDSNGLVAHQCAVAAVWHQSGGIRYETSQEAMQYRLRAGFRWVRCRLLGVRQELHGNTLLAELFSNILDLLLA